MKGNNDNDNNNRGVIKINGNMDRIGAIILFFHFIRAFPSFPFFSSDFVGHFHKLVGILVA